MGCALRLPKNDDIAALWHRGFGVGDLVVLFEDERCKDFQEDGGAPLPAHVSGLPKPGSGALVNFDPTI